MILDVINNVFRNIQTSIPGIPGPGAKIYRRVSIRILNRFHEKVVNEILGKIDKGPLLDIGCGTANILIRVAEKKKLNLLVGIDISKAMLALAQENIKETTTDSYIDLVQGDAQKLPIRNNAIEIVVSTGTLHHIPRPKEMFRECSRILHRNKSLCIIYEFSHDVQREELKKSAIELHVSPIKLKIIASLHGIPRKDFISGPIGRTLHEVNIQYKIVFDGIVTKIYIMP